LNKLHLYLANLDHNFGLIRKQLSSNTAIFGVVKAWAYGSDMIKIAKRLEQIGVDYLAVAYAEEGKILREGGINIPILVFYPQIKGLQTIIDYKLEPSLYSTLLLEKFRCLLKEKKSKHYPVHVKYNTGLNRVGFNPNQATWVLEQFKEEEFDLKTVYSHLATSESSENKTNNSKQIKTFLALKKQHEDNANSNPKFHLLNSSGIFKNTKYEFDAVRCGIALHGFSNYPHLDQKLKPLASLHTIISQIHMVKKGDNVGYDLGWKASKDSIIATLPIGHADGIGRHFGNEKAWVSVNGISAPIVGNVCMDMIMIDVSGISCKEEDIVVVFGPDHNASEFAISAGTISYEVLSGIGPRVKRIIHS
tara:strand:+ start:7486 stop:8574 length:1089 start_codon:yes stop_codon:yes gene_type:complete